MNHKAHQDHKEHDDMKDQEPVEQDQEDVQRAQCADNMVEMPERCDAVTDPVGRHLPISESTERTVRDVIGAAIAVHKQLGPGFIEPVYQRALRFELRCRNVGVEIEKIVSVVYRGQRLYDHRLDLLAGGSVIVEIKAVRKIRPIHRAQLLSYMKASGYRVGLLMNFNVTRLVDGLQRFVR
jgi:GxxExxY protein